MSDRPDLTEAHVRRWIDARSFERGQGYFREGRIRHPNLEALVELPVARAGGAAWEAVEPELIRRQVRHALLHSGDDWQAGARAAADLDRLVEHGHAEAVVSVVKERQAAGMDTRLTEWLRDYAQEHGDSETALDLSQQLFWERPSVPAYASVRAAAQAADSWGPVRADLIARLETREAYPLLTRIHLEEEDVDQALNTLQQTETSSYGSWGRASLRIEVARAAEEAYPDRAADLYLDAACTLIEQRGRGNYAQAAEYLGRIRTVYRRTGNAAAWTTVIDAIRNDNRNLPALQDELGKAEL